MINNNTYDKNNEGPEDFEQGNTKEVPAVSVLHRQPDYEMQRTESSGGPTLAGTGTPASNGTNAKEQNPLIQLGTQSKSADKRYIHIYVPIICGMEY
jgi:hypothetical protein